MSDRVTSCACDPSIGSWVILHVKIGVIEGSAEERYQVMATRAPT